MAQPKPEPEPKRELKREAEPEPDSDTETDDSDEYDGDDTTQSSSSTNMAVPSAGTDTPPGSSSVNTLQLPPNNIAQVPPRGDHHSPLTESPGGGASVTSTSPGATQPSTSAVAASSFTAFHNLPSVSSSSNK